MSNPKTTKAPQVSDGKTSKQRLDEIIAAIEPQLSDDAGQLSNEMAFVPQSKILMPDAAAMQAAITGAAANNKTISNLDPSLSAQLNQLDTALSHTENVKTTPSIFAIGNKAAQQPTEVRDIANNLYYQKARNGKRFYVREKADRVLGAIFGEGLEKRVQMAASMRGFGTKPMLWVGQTLWEDVEFDRQHDWVGEFTYSEDVDIDTNSPVVRALYMCFYHMTIRNVQRIAKEHKVGCLDVIRAIFKDVCDELKIEVAV